MSVNKQQLQRLFEEAERAGKLDFTKEREVKEFYGRISDYLAHLQDKEGIVKKIEKLRKDRVIVETEDELTRLGEEILEDLRVGHKLIKEILAEKKIELPSAAEVNSGRVPGVIYDVSAEESLGSEMDVLGRRIEEDRELNIHEIPQIISGFHSAVLELQYLGIANLYPNQEVQDIHAKGEKYQGLLDKRKRRFDLLRITDYDDLVEVKAALDSGSKSSEGLGFKFKSSYRYSKPSSSDWMTISSGEEKVKINKEREEYREKLARFHKSVEELLDDRPIDIKRFAVWLDEWWQIGLIRDSIKGFLKLIWPFALALLAFLAGRLF